MDKFKSLTKALDKSSCEMTILKSKTKEEAQAGKRDIRILKIEVEDETLKREQVLRKKKDARKQLDENHTNLKQKMDENAKLVQRSEKVNNDIESLQ